jgi:DNA polymerase III subunit gamma/tau
MATQTKQTARILEPLAIRYRPQTIDQIVGQKQVVTRLKGIFKSMKIPNAILLAGTSGCGKTTLGRIIARTLNCDTVTGCGKCSNCKAFDTNQHRDYVEINAADTRGIDDMRALIAKTKYLPQQGALRVYMIDEAQQLTPQAMQILLKPLESPGSRTLFIIGSMEPEKLLPAIVGRCQSFQLSALSKSELASYLQTVAGKEGTEFDLELCETIADLSDGQARLSLQILESALQFVEGLDKKPKNLAELVRKEVIESALVSADDIVAIKLVSAMLSGNQKAVHTCLLDTQSAIGMSMKALNCANYIMSMLFSINKHANVWHSPINKDGWATASAALDKVKQRVTLDDAEFYAAARFNMATVVQALVDFRLQLNQFVVPEVSLGVSLLESACLKVKQNWTTYA